MTLCRHSRRGVAALAMLLCLACGADDERDATTAHSALPIADQEDAVCGMLVREQSAPRSQVVYRDGERLFFCSLGDMLVHLDAPSPHGRAETIFVEVMSPDQDPLETHTGEQPWLPADEAVYVVGVPREGIMGEPVLAYATRADAEQVARQYEGAELLELAGLRDWWQALSRSR